MSKFTQNNTNVVSLGGRQRSGNSIRPQLVQAVFVDGRLVEAVGFRPLSIGERSLLSKPVHAAKRVGLVARNQDLSMRQGQISSFHKTPLSVLQGAPRGSNDMEYLHGDMAASMLGVEVSMTPTRWQGFFGALHDTLKQSHRSDVNPFFSLGPMAHDHAMHAQIVTGHRTDHTRDYEPAYKDADFGRAVINFASDYAGQGERWIPQLEQLVNHQVEIARANLDTSGLGESVKKGFRNKAVIYHHLLDLLKRSEETFDQPFHSLKSDQRHTLILENNYWVKLIEPSLLECAKQRRRLGKWKVAGPVRNHHLQTLDKDLVTLSRDKLAFTGRDVMSFPDIQRQVSHHFRESMRVKMPSVPANIPGGLGKEIKQLQQTLVALADFNCGDMKKSMADATTNVNMLLQNELNKVYGRQKLAEAFRQHGTSGVTAAGTVGLVTVAMLLEPVSVGTSLAAGAAIMRLGDLWNQSRNQPGATQAKINMIEQLQRNTVPGAVLPAYIQYTQHWLSPYVLLQESKINLAEKSVMNNMLREHLVPELERAFAELSKVCADLLKCKVHVRMEDATLVVCKA